jgi:hypothetical protein
VPLPAARITTLITLLDITILTDLLQMKGKRFAPEITTFFSVRN